MKISGRQIKLVHLGLLVSVVFNVILIAISVRSILMANTSDGADNRFLYPYLASRIFAESPNDVFVSFLPLRLEVRKYIEQNGKDTIGFYFEYLPSGSSIGVNEKLELPLASLFKIPVVIGVYQLVERGRLGFDTILTVDQEHINKTFGTLWQKGAGTKLSVREAIDLALIESDNTAFQLLYSLLPEEERVDLFEDLDILVQKTAEDYVYTIGTSKSYSSILRALYLSTFLSKEHSNEILETLTRTEFSDKLPAGVAPGVKTAHKIGVYQRVDTGGFVWSDCGVVYVPKRSYILCIMVQGSEEEARKHIAFLSKMVFDYASQVNARPAESGF